MSDSECRECGKDLAGSKTNCPHCGTPINPNIPKYPTFGGSGWPIIVIWVLFIVFMAMLLISMFTFRD